MKLFAFDLDGTLTQHKTKIERDNRDFLDSIQKNGIHTVIVGAGSCQRINSQLDNLKIDIIGNYGMQQSSHNQDDNELIIIKDNIVTVDRDNVNSIVEKLRRRYGLYPFVGESVEFHDSGLITFPILGTKATLEDKLNYDPNREKRRAMYAEVCEAFSDYYVVVGGTSSFDIVPKPYNKLYALCDYAKQRNIAIRDITYFGDDYGLGGNDEIIYKSDIVFVRVDDYYCLKTLGREYLNTNFR